MNYTISYTKIPSEERWLILINGVMSDIMINECSLGKVACHINDSKIFLEDTIDSDKIQVIYDPDKSQYIGVWDSLIQN